MTNSWMLPDSVIFYVCHVLSRSHFALLCRHVSVLEILLSVGSRLPRLRHRRRPFPGNRLETKTNPGLPLLPSLVPPFWELVLLLHVMALPL